MSSHYETNPLMLLLELLGFQIKDLDNEGEKVASVQFLSDS
jgi:hypothetical protein